VPSYSRIPDPEGAALLIESINSIDSSLVNINTQQLRKEGERIRRRMEELAKIMLSPDLVREKSEHVGDRIYT
jgi:predicted ATP-grasp superfamily ATP-dependent carboligase